MSRHCSSVKSVGYDLSFIAPLPQNLTPTRRVNNSPDQMSRDNNCLKFSKPCNGHALKGLVKNWWASDTSLKDNAMEASDATDSFVRNHAGVSDQVRPEGAGRAGRHVVVAHRSRDDSGGQVVGNDPAHRDHCRLEHGNVDV